MTKALLRLAAVRDTKQAGELRSDTVQFIASSSALVLRILSHVKRCVNMWTVCAQPDGSLRSLLQNTGSSPYVLVHIVGPLAATIRSPETHLKNHEYMCTRWKYSTREHSFLFNKVISSINQFSSWGCNFYSFFLNFISLGKPYQRRVIII